MKTRMKLLWTACLLAGLQTGAFAQEPRVGGLPADVYYLLPEFKTGLVYIAGQGPAQGDLNICAVDNTLRFKGADGQELTANEPDKIISVVIGDDYFIRDNGVFYRRLLVSGDIGIAVKRQVTIRTDVKRGAYGMEDHTSSIREYSTLYAEGVAFKLNENKEYPYTVDETLFLCRGNTVIPLTKRNLRKFFPDKKEEIDAWFKAGNSLPETIEGLQKLLTLWGPGE